MILFSPLRLIAFGSLIALARKTVTAALSANLRPSHIIWSSCLAAAESATVGTSFLPRSISGVPDAAVFFPLTASGPSGADITSQGSQQMLLGSINGTARCIELPAFPAKSL